jgi:hypothetical protein
LGIKRPPGGVRGGGGRVDWLRELLVVLVFLPRFADFERGSFFAGGVGFAGNRGDAAASSLRVDGVGEEANGLRLGEFVEGREGF